MNLKSILVWLRQDLCLADNPALFAALQRGLPVIPVFICAPNEEWE
jgi:deoxyribodipyrimidine photo-lyase